MSQICKASEEASDSRDLMGQLQSESEDLRNRRAKEVVVV